MARSIYCSKCKKEKEDSVRSESYCKGCKSERMRKAMRKKREAMGIPEKAVRKPYCNVCIVKANEGEDIRGRCGECHKLAQRERVKLDKLAKGLPLPEVKNKEFCEVCQVPKTNGRCLQCNNRRKNAKKSEQRRLAREAKGLRPWGFGRMPVCGKCGKSKEDNTAYYCRSCESEYEKTRWREVIAPIVNQRPVTMVCECGKRKSSTRKIYCDDCVLYRKREATRLSSQRRRDKLKKDGFVEVHKILTEDEKALRKAARNYLHLMLRQKMIKRLPCEVCGTEENIEAHHDDYTRPLDVHWLCKKHHYHHHTIHKLNSKEE